MGNLPLSEPGERLGRTGDGAIPGVKGSIEIEEVGPGFHQGIFPFVISIALFLAPILGILVAPHPFAVGETLRYDAKLGYFDVGTATVSVSRRVPERGVDAYVFTMAGQGGPPGLRLRYDLTSWVDSRRFHSLRFHRQLMQAGKVEENEYLIVPDSSRYREVGVPGEWVSPSEPLDELAFLYFLRTAPLQLGRSYTYSRYFRTGYNPIQVVVAAAREPVAMPDGRSVPSIPVKVTSRGMTMKLWLTDDARRLPAQLELPLQFGVVSLVLAGSK
jgi:hypothetical protein